MGSVIGRRDLPRFMHLLTLRPLRPPTHLPTHQIARFFNTSSSSVTSSIIFFLRILLPNSLLPPPPIRFCCLLVLSMSHRPRKGSSFSKVSSMEIEAAVADEEANASQRLNGLWPVDGIDPEKARFPCCIVWTPLPVVSWLAPYIGHVGIGREDGQVIDFAGSNFVNTNNFAYGAIARYIRLEREQCCFPPNLSAHKCKQSYRHAERGTSISWDDALHMSMQHFQHKYYNLFTCNCHSFVANCLNRLAYRGSVQWNMVNMAALILWKGQWVDGMSIVRSFFPFVAVLGVGILMAGWPFLVGMAAFSFLLIGWFVLRIYCMKIVD